MQVVILLSLADFFHEIMMEDWPLHLCRPKTRAKRKREPNMTPETISTAEIQCGFEEAWCLDLSSRGRCFVLTPEGLLAGGVPSELHQQLDTLNIPSRTSTIFDISESNV